MYHANLKASTIRPIGLIGFRHSYSGVWVIVRASYGGDNIIYGNSGNVR